MPYIPQDQRDALLDGNLASTPGELTFQLYYLIRGYVSPEGGFTEMAEVLAALEAAKLEFYRRVLGPYEDRKREENGDVP